MKVASKSTRRKVDASANNFKITVSNFGNTNTDDTHNNFELQDEHLDFEPEDNQLDLQSEGDQLDFELEGESISSDYEEQDYFQNNYNSNYSFSGNNSSAEEHTVSSVSPTYCRNSIQNSINQDKDKISNSYQTTLTNYTTDDNLSFSHTADLIPYREYLDKAEDGRKNDYLQIVPKPLTRHTTIDSSSSSDSGSTSFSQSEMEEENETEYDMNSDDENRLLESDEIESFEEYENTDSFNNAEHLDTDAEHLETSSVEDFDHSVQQPVFCDKRLSTSGYNILIKPLENKKLNLNKNAWKKKSTKIRAIDKKWRLHWEPQHQIKLFLEDIGYVAPLRRFSESSCSSESESVSRESSGTVSSSMSSFQITLNSTLAGEKRKYLQVEKFGFQPSAFKVPLPPTKRPPTRPKRTDSTSSSETILNRPAEKSVRVPEEDDAISIAASTIEPLDQDYQDSIKEETFSDYQYRINSRASTPNNSYVEHWISSQAQTTTSPLIASSNNISPLVVSSQPIPSLLGSPIPKPPLLSSASSHHESDRSVRIAAALSGGGVRINFNDVPKFFAGLCYHYYFNEHCVKPNCQMSHLVKEYTYLKKCKEFILPEELKKLYSYSVRFHVLFKDIYQVFLKAFGHFKMQNDLISCIDHFFDLKEKIDFKKAVKCTIEALEETGLTFIETIEKISFNVGFMRYPDLADILLDLLTSKYNVCENWEVIKRICRATNSIPPIYFERILSKLLLIESPTINELCKDVYNVIVKNRMTNLSLVDPQLLKPMKTLAEFGDKVLVNFIAKNLSIERERFEKSVQNINEQTPATEFDQKSVSDSDERFNHGISNYSMQRINRDEICSRASSRSSQSSDPGGTNPDAYSLQGVNNYHYVPQAVSTTAPNTGAFRVTVQNDLPPQQFPPTETRLVTHNTANISSVTPEVSGYPDAPIFGKFKFNQGFIFDESLHNLLPVGRHQVSMNDSHIVELNKCIADRNGSGFLRILDLYKSPSTIQHFVTMSVAEIKSCREPCNHFLDLLENIGSIEPNFKSNPLLKGVFEVITFNMLLVFERKCKWADARRLVEVFNDWDSLISSKCLQQFGLRKLTPMGRYILLAKLLTKSKAFYYAYEILQSPQLNLLNSPNTWPLYKIDNIDLESRNSVLVDFFKYAYRNNVDVVCDIYRRIFQFGNIYQFDAYSYFNPMLETLINKEKSLLLKYVHSNIEIFYQKMERNIFRAFTIFMENNLSLESKMKLYEYGCQKGIYVQFTGKEHTVVVRTNMPDNEVKLILHYYFNALSRLSLYEVNHNLIIEIRLPDGIVQSPKILQCIRSISELNISIRKIVNECFRLQIITPNHVNSTELQIPKVELQKLLRF